MPGLLTGAAVSDEQRRRNDRHNPAVVALVLATLAVYLYLFTSAADPLGLPRPAVVAERVGMALPHVFDSDANVDSNVSISLTSILRSDDERLVFFLIAAAAFVSAYFLPLRLKQGSLALWSSAAVFLLYGPATLAGLLLAHLAVYLVLHPRRERNLVLSAAAGLFAYWAFVHDFPAGLVPGPFVLGLPVLAVLVYRGLLLPLLARPRIAPVLRTLTVQSAILTVCISALVEGLGGGEWSLPLGLLLFFWHWERLMMYHVDYKDGLIPAEIRLDQYLAVFLTPGQVPNWTWGVTIGQGYAYVHNNFLCEDKNRIVLGGVKLWAIALIYLVFWDWIRHLLIDLFTALEVPVYRAYTKELVRHFVDGGPVTTASVLATTFLDLVRWTMLWAGVVHFKVGLWRVCGYRVDPYIHRPWASTNLTMLWSRFTFHYREFLVRCFYYPVFFRVFKRRPYLRVFVAIMAAAGFGNLVWGHVPERLFYRGMEAEHALHVLGTWPYFVLLGLGIAVSQLYLMGRRRTRRPWTWDRWLWSDVLAVYLTLQYYALIHIFARPVEGGTVWELFRLFALGFGIRLEQ